MALWIYKTLCFVCDVSYVFLGFGFVRHCSALLTTITRSTMTDLPIDNNYTILAALAVVLYSTIAARDYTRRRSPTMFEQRLIWDGIMERHSEPAGLHCHRQMRRKSFDKLLGYIRDDLEVDRQMAARRGGAILPEI